MPVEQENEDGFTGNQCQLKSKNVMSNIIVITNILKQNVLPLVHFNVRCAFLGLAAESKAAFVSRPAIDVVAFGGSFRSVQVRCDRVLLVALKGVCV